MIMSCSMPWTEAGGSGGYMPPMGSSGVAYPQEPIVAPSEPVAAPTEPVLPPVTYTAPAVTHVAPPVVTQVAPPVVTQVAAPRQMSGPATWVQDWWCRVWASSSSSATFHMG